MKWGAFYSRVRDGIGLESEGRVGVWRSWREMSNWGGDKRDECECRAS